MTVVFEIRSPNDTQRLMDRKFRFYQRYGVREYVMYDPVNNRLEVYLRQGAQPVQQTLQGDRFTSPTLGIHLQHTLPDVLVFNPDGAPFRTAAELDQLRRDAEQRLARQSELTRKLLRGEAMPEELAELRELVNDSAT